MKKAIIIIFCILTCNFFSVSYTLTSHEYFNHIVYAEKELPDFYSIQIPHDIMNNDSTQILHTVENCLDKYQGNLFITKNKDNHYKKYVYLTHDKNQYLKSTPMFDHTFTFNIYTLDRLLSDGYQLEGEVHVTFPNEQSFNQFKNEMNATLHISIKDLNDSGGQVDYLIICILMINHFKDVKAIDFLKNKGPSKTIIYFNQVVLFIMVLVILFLSSIGIETGYSLLSRMNNHNEWNTMKHYSILSEVSNVENSDLFTSQSFLKLKKNFIKNSTVLVVSMLTLMNMIKKHIQIQVWPMSIQTT